MNKKRLITSSLELSLESLEEDSTNVNRMDEISFTGFWCFFFWFFNYWFWNRCWFFYLNRFHWSWSGLIVNVTKTSILTSSSDEESLDESLELESEEDDDSAGLLFSTGCCSLGSLSLELDELESESLELIFY